MWNQDYTRICYVSTLQAKEQNVQNGTKYKQRNPKYREGSGILQQQLWWSRPTCNSETKTVWEMQLMKMRSCSHEALSCSCYLHALTCSISTVSCKVTELWKPFLSCDPCHVFVFPLTPATSVSMLIQRGQRGLLRSEFSGLASYVDSKARLPCTAQVALF